MVGTHLIFASCGVIEDMNWCSQLVLGGPKSWWCVHPKDTTAALKVFRAQLPTGTAEYEWDLRSQVGASVQDGSYIVIVQTGGSVLRRRLFVLRSGS